MSAKNTSDKCQTSTDGPSVHCAFDKMVPLDKLKPYPRNNRLHPDAQLDLLVKAIKAQGWRAPITVSNKSGYIVRGHARLEAARRLKLTEVPVDYQHYASDQAEQADRIADNQLAILAEWDLPNLKEELLAIDDGSLDMEITGFSEKAIEELMTQCHQDGEADKEFGPLGEKYEVIISCAGESEQIELLERFTKEGLKCKAFIL